VFKSWTAVIHFLLRISVLCLAGMNVNAAATRCEQAYHPMTLQIPVLYPKSPFQNHYNYRNSNDRFPVPAYLLYTADYLEAGVLNHTPYVATKSDGARGPEVARISGERYSRRPWSNGFVDSRVKIAVDYADRSFYYEIASDQSHERSDTTIGVTYSSFTQADFEARSVTAILQKPPEQLTAEDRRFLLPQEESLGVAVTRYYDKSGRGIILEFRSNSKEKGSPKLFGDQMLVEEIRMAFEIVKDYPDLYDQPIIYTYGDEVSLKMYHALGFEVQTHITPLDQPIEKDGTKWWVIAVTPKRFEANLFKIRYGIFGHNIDGVNQPFPLHLVDGRIVTAAAHTNISFDRDGHVTELTLDHDAEVAPDVWASAGSRVHWLDGKIDYVQKTAKSLMANVAGPSFEIPAGSEVKFIENESSGYRVEQIRNNEREIFIDGSGLSIAPNSIAKWDLHLLTIQKLGRTIKFRDGVVVSAGAGLQVKWKGDHYDWTYIDGRTPRIK